MVLIIYLTGWFAKDPKILGLVGHVLLQLPFGVQRNPRSVLIADDCFELLKTPVSRITESVVRSTEKLLGSMSFIFTLVGY